MGRISATTKDKIVARYHAGEPKIRIALEENVPLKQVEGVLAKEFLKNKLQVVTPTETLHYASAYPEEILDMLGILGTSVLKAEISGSGEQRCVVLKVITEGDFISTATLGDSLSQEAGSAVCAISLNEGSNRDVSAS